jgi:hypothetical protein
MECAQEAQVRQADRGAARGGARHARRLDHRSRLRPLLAILLLALAGGAAAQDFPHKPIRLLLTFSAGGQADVLARFVAAEAEKWGRAVRASGASAD